ncbi:ATP-dependent Zn protease [Cyanobacterium aponinum AL20118]|uniref:ATP-dependent Zn protease n=2 Tax=Cyanobacterium aponinum TaxID=379064 RepID=K9Z768_CYAAP|nr:hypothetical protein [Cyanobacterium aponinum]AFZ54587.1 hypothetical protein Cyan10605_2506 [Cyanobacterium aponinum PCC 10605]WPF88013.1 ATP-dependent Zn protease [Cyanobacterium aponinum AL20115]
MEKNDIGLNILAIGIFSITLLVLVGPLLSISPFIPATITFILLSLVTVDTLAWGNQGTNLFLNLFLSEEQKQRIIHHEAGHFLTAYLYEIPIIGYTLTPWENMKINNLGSGGVMFDTSFLEEKGQDLRELNLLTERFAVVLMAGIAAEKLVYKNSEGGEEDNQKLSEIYKSLGINYSQIKIKQRLAILQAETLIEKYKDAYFALVEAMGKRLSVTECQAIIEEKKSSQLNELTPQN